VGSVDRVKLLESRLGPDTEATEMTSRSELKEVQVVHTSNLNTRDVAESLVNVSLFGVDDEGSSSLDLSSVPHLSLSSPDRPGVNDLLHIIIGIQVLEKSYSLLGLDDAINGRVSNHKGYLGNLFDSVSSGENQGRHRGGSKRRANSESLLSDIDLPVPFPPGFGGSKHASSAAHVSESSLTSSVGTTSRHTRNTRHSSSSSPGLGRGLVTCDARHSVGLSLVLRHVGMDIPNEVRTNR